MPPNPSSASGELSGYHMLPEELDLDILLPNGLLLCLNCKRGSSLLFIKQQAWKEAKKLPLFNVLQNPSIYVFVIINNEGEREEIYDESRRLGDLHLYWGVLRLIEPVGNREEKLLNSKIGFVIGRSLMDFDESRDPELIQARLSFLQVSRHYVENRNVEDSCDSLCDTIEKNGLRYPSAEGLKLRILTSYDEESRDSSQTTIQINANARPMDVITEVIRKRLKKQPQNAINCVKESVDEKARHYLLKVTGLELYFFKEDVPIIRYSYIQSCLKNERIPQLEFKDKQAVIEKASKCATFLMPSFAKRYPLPIKTGKYANSNSEPKLLYRINENFQVKVICASYVNLNDDTDEIFVKAGIFHGTEQICVKETPPAPCKNPRWNETLKFDLYVADIPAAAQICFSICSQKRRKQKQAVDVSPLAWANLRLIDFCDKLISGHYSLHFWSFPKDFEGHLNPLGQNNSNSNRDKPCLELEFTDHKSDVYFPSRDEILAYTSWGLNNKVLDEPEPITEADKQIFDDLQKRDALHEMSVQEKETMWKLRKFCKEYPDSLPRLLDATYWSKREFSSQVYVLLDEWPLVTCKTALELLDVKYPDKAVRSFAVRCLEKLLDEELNLYLIYLIQVIKNEPFMENDLSKFLLIRALSNRVVGHVFFWLARSEAMHDCSRKNFALLLEAYCRGCGNYLDCLSRQVTATERLTALNLALKEKRGEDTTKLLMEQLKKIDFQDALQQFENPVNNSIILGDLILDRCRVMTSAKRPLWIVWSNAEPIREPDGSELVHEILFKTGDDLRQDMLTLQTLKIMNAIWREEGIDFHLTAYKCLPMGKHIGMIEVVQKAKTILEIQNTQGKMGVLNTRNSSLLHKWIRDKAGNKYEKAVEKFTSSCAGYCVATFVLGIGDRHSSNIMLTEDGRIFHIDFGHFLGHYKKKFGISRERVPFVLTEDFIYVITKGADNAQKTKEFKAFQDLCSKAYLILHRNAHLFITLFTMMLPMGIPELQKLEDIQYLRRTLAVGKNEKEAEDYFNEQLNDAYEGGWTTKVDWFFHSIRHT